MTDTIKKPTKLENAISHIFCDYKAILEFVMTCRNNHLDYSSYMGIMPFFCMYVLEGYNFLCKNNIINKDCITTQELEKLEKCRSVGVKLHSNFKKKTFNSINNFNREEYIKFFNKAGSFARLFLTKSIKNYFVCCIDNYPIGNYHLYSKKVLDMEIGTYIDDVSPQVFDYAYLLSSFSAKIVIAIDKTVNPDLMGQEKISMQFDYADLNMAYDYTNFRIKQSPPILMALLDVLCVLNSYRKIFTQINKDRVFDIKIKFTILFYAILSLKAIFNYCDTENIDIQAKRDFIDYILGLDKQYVKNNLRKFCMHYDFPSTDWKEDPFTEAFELEFQKPIKNVSQDLSEVLNTLANKLQEYLIVKNFSQI